MASNSTGVSSDSGANSDFNAQIAAFFWQMVQQQMEGIARKREIPLTNKLHREEDFPVW